MTRNMPTELYVWNVENGTAIYAKTPNNKNVVIDCGASTSFSPAKYLDSLGVRIDFLVISHPHRDHIEDLEGIEGILNEENVFCRNPAIEKDLMVKSNEDLKDDECLERYFALSENHTGRLTDEGNPENPWWGDGCVFRYFRNGPEAGEVGNSTINNMSLVTFIVFGKDVVLYGGDMEESGWEKMLDDDGGEFKALLEKTTIYIASHHGNKSGVSSELFKHLKPKLTIISSSKKRDYDAVGEYCEHTTGMSVFKDGERETRKVVTTRSDGHIHVTLHGNNTEPTVVLVGKSKH